MSSSRKRALSYRTPASSGLPLLRDQHSETEEPGSDEPDEYIVSVIKTLQDRLYTLNDLPALGSYYFQLPDYDTDSSKQLYASVPSTEYGAILSEALEHGAEDADSLIAKLLNGRKHKNVMSTLRHALTGQKVLRSHSTSLD